MGGNVVLFLILLGAGRFWLGLTIGQALAGGAAALVLHWLGDLGHHLGHAWAARRTGHPMIGIRFWGFLSTSVYPDDEGALPAQVHMRRALGGPLMSLALGLAAGLLAAALFPLGGLPRYLSLFAALENLLMYGLGAFLPVGFTDGSTLLHWRGKA